MAADDSNRRIPGALRCSLLRCEEDSRGYSKLAGGGSGNRVEIWRGKESRLVNGRRSSVVSNSECDFLIVNLMENL